MKEIQTKRLTVRHIVKDDWRGIQKIWVDINTSEYARYDIPHNTDSTDVKVRIERWAKACEGKEHIFFAVCLENTVIGYVSFNIIQDGYEIGYCFHSMYHRKGYAQESLTALMSYIKSIGAKKLTAGTALDNMPSVKLLTSLDFKLAEVEKVSFYKDESGTDIVFDGGIFEKIL